MGKFSKGRYSLMVSDRSGAAFPYREMFKNGMVHGYIILNMNLNSLKFHQDHMEQIHKLYNMQNLLEQSLL